MQKASNDITIFLFVTTLLILLMAGFILTILFLYRKNQIAYQKNLEEIKSDYEKNLLKTQLEIQEQTFQNISREIHDNISLSLTLAKLNLNVLDLANKEKITELVNSSIELIGGAINDLSDISHSLNSEVISGFGLIKALEYETNKLKKLGWYSLQFEVTGNPVFMESQKELFIFRIVQESFNNILKHSRAKNISLYLYFAYDHVDITIADDGVGFAIASGQKKISANHTAGLSNMQKRADLINGKSDIKSIPGKGTTIKIAIPY